MLPRLLLTARPAIESSTWRLENHMLKRWRLCLAIFNIDEAELPTEAMAKSFTVFLFKCRQKRSVHGREGLGDSMGEMAQYTLAQVRKYGRE